MFFLFSTLSHRKTPFWKTPSRTAPSVEYIPVGWATCSGLKNPPGVQWKRQSMVPKQLPSWTWDWNIPKWGHFVKQPWHKLTIKTSNLCQMIKIPGFRGTWSVFFWAQVNLFTSLFTQRWNNFSKAACFEQPIGWASTGGILPPCLFTKSVPLLRLYWIKWWNN